MTGDAPRGLTALEQATERIRAAGKALVAGLIFDLPPSVDPQQLIRDFQAAVLEEKRAEHEADLERIRDQMHRLGVQSVVDSVRGRLQVMPNAVPFRDALLAHLAVLEQSSGLDRG